MGLILAGGRSRRMAGNDKASCLLGGESLIARAARRLAPQVSAVAIAAGGDPDRFVPLCLDAAIVADDPPVFAGPLAGVVAGLAWARRLSDRPDGIVTVAVDAPFFPADLALRLREGGDGAAVAIGDDGRLQPTFAYWPLDLADRAPLRPIGGTTAAVPRLRDVLEACGARKVRFEAEADGVDPFFNVNGPDDLAAADRLLSAFED